MTAPSAIDSWGEQLRALRHPVPAGLVDRARAAAVETVSAHDMRTRRRGVRASLLVALVAVIALLINGAAVYFLPTYANALGHIPGAGALVKWSGLGVGDVNVIYATAAHGGVRLSVTAAFADRESHTPDDRGLWPSI